MYLFKLVKNLWKIDGSDEYPFIEERIMDQIGFYFYFINLIGY
jgi:hypothetical protein